jgi:hypothetical protein
VTIYLFIKKRSMSPFSKGESKGVFLLLRKQCALLQGLIAPCVRSKKVSDKDLNLDLGFKNRKRLSRVFWVGGIPASTGIGTNYLEKLKLARSSPLFKGGWGILQMRCASPKNNQKYVIKTQLPVLMTYFFIS